LGLRFEFGGKESVRQDLEDLDKKKIKRKGEKVSG